jgi:5-methylcytosine-specific restriction endonuclease McrA
MDVALQELVRHRALDACEYCRLPQSASPYVRFHIDHIVARQHGGQSEPDNLALACGYCNRHKGPNLASCDPTTGELVPLFNPRRDRWTDHFAWNEATIVGKSQVGQVTIHLLGMNDHQQFELRKELQALGEPFIG